MEALAQWMARKGETDTSLAGQVGLTRPQLSRIRRGKSTPSLATAAKLEQLTGIPAREWAK